MDLSFALPTSGSWATPENITAIARTADERGWHGLWTFQRVLFPEEADLAAVYQSVLDPLVTLGFAAAATTRARLGLAVVNGPFFAPAVLAKQLATIDVLSGGRLDAGIGLGWHPDEYAAAGVPMPGRGRRFDEWLDCLDALLSSTDVVSFSGEFYRVPSSSIEPSCVQRPRPPIYIGGSSDAAYRRAARYDGWIASSRASIDDISQAIATMRDAAEQAGHPRSSRRCVVRGVTLLREAPLPADGRRLLNGSLEQIRGDIAAFEAAGVDELFFDLNFDSERVGSPDVDPRPAIEMAYAVLESCLQSWHRR
ncbi:MAG: TIGR03619 family F420-dependent LLM class oxidoreductase [Steroidobacteraceae bacterium]